MARGMECTDSSRELCWSTSESRISWVVMGISREAQFSRASRPLWILARWLWERVTQRCSYPAVMTVPSSKETSYTGRSPCGNTLVTLQTCPRSSKTCCPTCSSPMGVQPSVVGIGVLSSRSLPVPISMASMAPGLSRMKSSPLVWWSQAFGGRCLALVILPSLPASLRTFPNVVMSLCLSAGVWYNTKCEAFCTGLQSMPVPHLCGSWGGLFLFPLGLLPLAPGVRGFPRFFPSPSTRRRACSRQGGGWPPLSFPRLPLVILPAVLLPSGCVPPLP